MLKVINDAGHGGRDPGGGNSKYWNEKDIVLKIAHYCNTRLNELGIESGMTREKDIYLSARERTDIVKKSGARICISHHINAAENINAKGAEVIHSIFSNGELANIIMEELMTEGATKRRVFSKRGNNDPTKDYYFMHRMTGSVETVIVEYGFGTNDEDVEKINDNWKNYAETVVRAVCKYLNFTYKQETKEKEEKIKLSKIKISLHGRDLEEEGVFLDNVNYIPVRFLDELGYKVAWDNDTDTILIDYKGENK